MLNLLQAKKDPTLRTLEARLRNARYLGELVKFQVAPFGGIFVMLKVCCQFCLPMCRRLATYCTTQRSTIKAVAVCPMLYLVPHGTSTSYAQRMSNLISEPYVMSRVEGTCAMTICKNNPAYTHTLTQCRKECCRAAAENCLCCSPFWMTLYSIMWTLPALCWKALVVSCTVCQRLTHAWPTWLRSVLNIPPKRDSTCYPRSE